MTGLEFRVLGPLEVRAGDELLDLGPRKQRAVLAALLVAAPEVVAVGSLIDRVWGDEPPDTAGHALQVYVSNLRRLLEPDRPARTASTVLVTHGPGYQLVVAPDQIDAMRFESGVAAARRLASGDPGRAADQLAELLDLWRGPALADVADVGWARDEAGRLDALRISAVEAMFTSALSAGRHVEVVDRLEATARRHPLREGLWRDLIVALYRCGRQADALRAYATLRDRLIDELGIEPAGELVQLEAAVLRHEPSLDWQAAETSAANPVPVELERVAESGRSEPTPTASTARAGTALRSAPGPQGGVDEVADERRIVTVLFADLVGSTPLGEVLDDDEYKLVIDGAVERIVSPLERYGGRVVNVAGDGVTALFGAPVSHEDDAERAVLAGLEIVEDVDGYGHEVARSWGVDPLRARVGVNTGPVVTGLSGAGERVDFNAAGDTMNTAARLESATRPGTVLVGAAARAQLGPDFTFADACWLDLKGKADLVEAYEATGGRPGGGRPRGLPGRRAPLIGRASELDVLADLACEVNAGRGGALFLTGEAGLGKTRLIAELRRLCNDGAHPDRPPLWMEGACISYGDNRPLWPLRRLIDGWIGAPPGLAPMRVRVALRRAVDHAFDPPEADRFYRAVAALTGCDQEASAQLLALDAAVRQREIHSSVRLLVERLSTDRPLIIAIDDLHWADDETLDLLDQLLPIIDEAPVLLAVVARPEPGHGSWRIRERLMSEFAHRTRALDLDALPATADSDLLDALVGSDVLPDEMHRDLLLMADGNPFYLEELIRSLIAHGALVEVDGGFEVRGTLEDVALPETVEQVIVSRLDRLDPEARRVLTAASVIGREFEIDLLLALVGDVGGLDPLLVDLQRLDLIREIRRWPEAEYRFEHPLIQEAAYAALVSTDRRELHRSVATALADRPDSERSTARRGHHLELSGDDVNAAVAYQQASDDAEASGLFRAAHALSGAGQRVVERLGSSADPGVVARLGFTHVMSGYFLGEMSGEEKAMRLVEFARRADDPLTEARLLQAAAVPHILDGDDARRRQRFIESLSAARRADDLPTLVRALDRLAIDEANALELDEARARAIEAMVLTDGGAVEARVPALDARKLVALYLGELDELELVLDELFSFAGEPAFEIFERNIVVEAAVLDQALGSVEDALDKVDRAIQLTEELTGPGDRGMVLAVKSRILRSRGSYTAALECGLEGFAAALEIGHGYWLPWTAAEYGMALAEVGAFAEAAEVLTHGCSGEQASMPSQELRCAGALALVGLLAGDEQTEATGVEVAERLLSQLSVPDGHAYLYGADAMLALAEVHVRRGRVNDAMDIARTCGGAADDAGWLEPAARARYVLGLIAASEGDHDAAALELGGAIERSAGAWPGIEWRSRFELARLTGDEAERASGAVVVDELCSRLDAERARVLREHAATLR